MTVGEFCLLRGGFLPRQLGLPDSVQDPKAPRGLPLQGTIGRSLKGVPPHPGVCREWEYKRRQRTGARPTLA